MKSKLLEFEENYLPSAYYVLDPMLENLHMQDHPSSNHAKTKHKTKQYYGSHLTKEEPELGEFA